MTVNTRDLSILAYANGFSMWHYRTSDPPAVVHAAGYFDRASDMLRPGDMLILTCIAANTATTAVLIVTHPTPGTVSVTPLTGPAA